MTPTPSARHRLPRERQSLTHKVTIGEWEGYITAGRYEDGSLGEIFVAGFGKAGSTQVGWINSWAIAISMALQYGTSLDDLAAKYHAMKFEPNGPTDNPYIPECLSIPDYIFRWLALRFGSDELRQQMGVSARRPSVTIASPPSRPFIVGEDDVEEPEVS